MSHKTVLKDVEFTDEEIEEIVEPAKRVAVAFGRAIAATLRQTPTFEDAWENFAEEACRFMKQVD